MWAVIFLVSIKSSQGEFIKSFNLSPFLPAKASHSHFESKPLHIVTNAKYNKIQAIQYRDDTVFVISEEQYKKLINC